MPRIDETTYPDGTFEKIQWPEDAEGDIIITIKDLPDAEPRVTTRRLTADEQQELAEAQAEAARSTDPDEEAAVQAALFNAMVQATGIDRRAISQAARQQYRQAQRRAERVAERRAARVAARIAEREAVRAAATPKGDDTP